jgi:hypothetical protein
VQPDRLLPALDLELLPLPLRVLLQLVRLPRQVVVLPVEQEVQVVEAVPQVQAPLVLLQPSNLAGSTEHQSNQQWPGMLRGLHRLLLRSWYKQDRQAPRKQELVLVLVLVLVLQAVPKVAGPVQERLLVLVQVVHPRPRLQPD